MGAVQNVLFIMADQLRADHLGCYGHPYLETPSLDGLAARGARFTRAFVNSGVCGPSRMSYYTGRYPSRHGATWNRVPLSVNEITLGEYLAGQGRDLALAGKTHVIPDKAGMERLAIDGASELGILLNRGGFVELDRYDGHHEPGAESGYPAFLRRHGYDSADPWTDYVIAGVDASGQVVSGWNMRNVHLPSRVAEAHSETAYMTDQALDFMKRRGGQPWVLHLSYVKPHWPYMAPDPYHRRYRADQCLPVRRNLAELENAHPVVAAYRQHEESVSFSSDDCVRVVRPAYQGLIRQLDDHLGRLFDYMEGAGLMKNTLIVFTADHGDFLGDHWLGEKELFYDTVQRVPFIVMDPSGEADATRGQALDHMVESVDLVPTVLRALDAPGRRTGWKDASCRKCCMACRTASPGATACIRSWTTASARPACCAARRRAMPAPGRCARTGGAMCTGWTSRSSCTTCRPIPKSSRTWGPAPRTPRCAGPCATVCWNGCCAAAPAPR